MLIGSTRKVITANFVASGVVAVLIGIAVFCMSHIVEKLILAVVLSTTTFFLVQALLSQREEYQKFPQKGLFMVAIEVGAIISLIILLATPSLSAILYIVGLELLPLMILRAGSSLFLMFFFPGYILLSIPNRLPMLSEFERFIISYPVSLAVIICMGVASSLYPFFPAINTIFFLSQALLIIIGGGIVYRDLSKQSGIHQRQPIFSRHRLDRLILPCLLLFTAIGGILSRLTMLNVVNLDIWIHMGDALGLVNHNIPIWSSPLGTLSYPWGHKLIIAVFLGICGLPIIASAAALGLLDIMPILAFYLMVSAAFRKPSAIPIIATFIWTTFGGFGWIIIIASGMAQGVTNLSDWYRILFQGSFLTWGEIGRLNGLYNTFIDPFSPILVGLMANFILFYLLLKRNLQSIHRIFIGIMVVFSAFMMHIAEISIFAIFLLLIMLAVKREAVSRVRDIGIAAALGMSIVLIIELISATPCYLIHISFVPTAILFLFTAAVSQIRIMRHLSPPFENIAALSVWDLLRRKFFLPIFAILIIYFWGLALIVWPLGAQHVIIRSTYDVNSSLVPWFAYPQRLGSAGLLMLGAIIVAVMTRTSLGRNINLFLALSITSIVGAHALSYIRSFIYLIPYWEPRFLPFIFTGVSVTAAAFLCKASTRMLTLRDGIFSRTSTQRITLGILLSLVIISGIGSTILNVDYGFLVEQSPDSSKPDHISELELEALNYLRLNRVSDSLVATVSRSSYAFLKYFTGARDYVVRINPISTSILSKSSFYQFMFPFPDVELGSVNQFYLANRDKEQLQAFDDEVLMELAEKLPVEFANEEVTIYRMPVFYPESMSEGLRLTTTGKIPPVLLESLSLSALPYRSQLETDCGLFNGSEILLPTDFQNPGWAEFNFEETGNTNRGSGDVLFQSEEGVGILNVSNAQSPTWFNAYTEMNTTLNTSTWKYMYVKVRTSESTRWGINLWDADAEQWLPTVSDRGIAFSHHAELRWAEFVIDFKSAYGNVNYSRVMLSGWLDSGTSGVCEWDWCLASRQPFMQILNITRYLDWVSQGGQLVVLDYHGLGEIATRLTIISTGETASIDRVHFPGATVELPTLELPIYSAENISVEVVATFANATGAEIPFVFQIAWGDGQIRYVLMKALFETLRSDSTDTQKTLFEVLGQLMCIVVGAPIQGPRTVVRLSPGSAKEIQMTGSVYLTSTALATDLRGINPIRVNFTQVGEWYLDGILQTGSELTGLTLVAIDVSGRVNLTVNSVQATIIPSLYGGYTLIDNPTDCTVKWKLDNQLIIHVLINGSEHEIRVEGGTLALDLQSLRCLLRNPITVENEGITRFEEGSVLLSTGRRISQQNASIDGFISFNAVVSTVELQFENFNATGRILLEQPSVGPSFEEWMLPWPLILLSPPHIAWVVGLSFVSNYLLRRYRHLMYPGRKDED